MAESTLAVDLPYLRAEVGHYLGYGRGSVYSEVTWTTPQSNSIEAVVRSGLRQFYDPPPVDGVTYYWSFLTPSTSITLTAGDAEATLPDGFNAFAGQIAVALAGQSFATWRVELTGEPRVREFHRSTPNATGRPWLVAEKVSDDVGSETSQRYVAYVYPTPDAAYQLTFNYRLLADRLTDLLPHHYGGASHAETVLASCLAAAEDKLDDRKGVKWERWVERLRASIATDKRHKAGNYGYNGDRSDGRYDRFPGMNVRRVTYNGQTSD